MISKDALGHEVIALGELMGLLSASSEGITLNADWFNNPNVGLGSMGKRLDRLVALLNAILGPGVPMPLDGFPNAQWYPLPVPGAAAGSIFHVVAPGDAATSGQLGFGVRHSVQSGKATFTAFFYIPLFSYGPAGVQFIANSIEHPCQIGVGATGKFQVSNTSFTSMSIEAEIYLADKIPGFKLIFNNNGAVIGEYNSLASLLDPTVESWLGEVLVQGSSWLDTNLGDYWVSIGDILVGAQFLERDDQGAYHLNLAELQGQSATEIALQLIFGALYAFSNPDNPLAIVELPGGGLYVVRQDNNDGSATYGLRLSAEIALTAGQNTDGKASPAIDLCLGTWLTGEDDNNNWLGQSIDSGTARPGVSIFILHCDNNFNFSFAPGFELSSVGLNIKGGGDAPLVNVKGYTLRGAELRAYLNSSDWTFGFAARLDDVGFPLGAGLEDAQQGGGESNGVAKNLLAAGQSESDESDKSAVNPAFSATAAYVKGHDPLLEIYDAQGVRTDLIWFPVQRRFGPVNCQKVGLRVDVTGAHKDDPVLGVVFDGGVALAALDVELDQLSVNVHLKKIADISGYELDLQGLEVSFNSGGVAISGGLLKTTESDGSVAYDGEALIKFEELAISAVGSYSSLPNNGGVSMFIFAVLNGPLGGPAFFYVTGLMAGFGYNRSLRIPEQNEVSQFPLVGGLTNSNLIGGGKPDPRAALSALKSWVPPSRGTYWLAAGLEFTTFEIIKTRALLVVEFGKEFIIAIFGISILKQPLAGETYVYAELDIEVVFKPLEGEFKASAVLAPSSFVFTPDAHITGGFAFYTWFGSNEHAGDFVFTIGGYHPAFKVPSHYPQEPRVGINWQVSDAISIVGGAYFAITPTAMMAGGGLALTFTAGPLKAWFKAQIDIIIFWKPFYLIADASVSIGVSLRLTVFGVDTTISLEIGAAFHLWGPPMGGTVHVDLYIISFTIGFGKPMGQTGQLSWDEFKGLLPTKTQEQDAPAARAAATTTTTPVYLHINSVDGLKNTHEVDGLTLWLVRAGHFKFAVGSALPASTVVIESQDAKDNRTITGSPVGIRGVDGGISAANYRSTQTISIIKLADASVDHIRACLATSSPCANRPSGCNDPLITVSGWQIDAATKGLPQAMWGSPVPAGQTPDINPDTATVPATVGVTMYAKPQDAINGTPAMNVANVFASRTVNADDERRLPLWQTQPLYDATPQAADSFADIAGANALPLTTKRNAVFAALQELGINGWTNDPLTQMAAHPGQAFADEPLEGSPAQSS